MGCYGAITQLPPNNGYETYDTSNDPLNKGNVGQWGANALFGCYGGAKSVSEREKYFALRIVQFYLNKGLTLDQSCAIAGNMRSEGGFCQGAQNWVKDTNDISFGMFAMYRGNCGAVGKGGAYCSYKPWCEKNKRVYWLLDSQMEYMFYNINNGKPALKKYFSPDGDGSKASLRELCFQWASLVEVCGGAGGPCQQRNHQTQTNRYNNANRIKNIVLNWQYFTQNGECVTSETTSNIDSSSETTDASNMSESCNKLINGISALRGGHTPQSTDAIDSYLQSLLESPTGETVSVSTNENNNEIKIELNEWACIGGGHEIEGVKSVLFECFRTDDDIVKHIDEFYKLPYKLKTFSLGSKINCKYLVFSIPWTYYVEFFEKMASILGDKDPGPQNTYKQDHKSRFKGAFKNFSRLLYNTCYSDFIRNNITYKYMYILPSAVTSMDIKRTLCSKLRKDKPGHNYLCYDFVDNKDFLRYMYDIIEHAILEIVSKGFKSYLIVSDDYNLYTKEHSEDLKKNMIITRNTIQKAGRLQDQPKLNCIGNGCKDASEEAYNKKFGNLLKLFNPLYK